MASIKFHEVMADTNWDMPDENSFLRWGAAWENIETLKIHNSSEIFGGTSTCTNRGVSCVREDEKGIAYLCSLIKRTSKNGPVRGNIFRLTGHIVGKCSDGQSLIRPATCQSLGCAKT